MPLWQSWKLVEAVCASRKKERKPTLQSVNVKKQ